MSKAFVKESSDADEDDDEVGARHPSPPVRDYLTPRGYQRLKDDWCSC